MRKDPVWRRYLRFFGPDVPADVNDELAFHLETKIEELQQQGLPLEKARAEANRQFGDLTAVRQTCESLAGDAQRQTKLVEAWTAFWQDVHYGARQLRHAVGTTALALVTLAIGIGVVTAVFSVVYAVVLQPLPFPRADRLVSVWSVRQGILDVVTPRNFDTWKREAHSFQRIGALQRTTFTLSLPQRVTQLPGGLVSSGFFSVFGIHPVLGRTFTPEDDRSPRSHLAIVSHQLWNERFGADPRILGTQIHLNRETYTVIGVMPSSFSVRAGSEQLWVPLALSGREMSWTGGVLEVAGRLRDGVTLQQSQAEMNVLARSLEALYPDMNRHRGIQVRDYSADLVGDYKSRLLILLGAVGLVLLIACSNVANLLLARAAGRKQEFAMRAAVGATRFRVIRQLLTESLLVGLAGSTLGLGLALLLIHLVSKLNLSMIPRFEQARINMPVFFFALFLGLLSTILAAVLPAIRAAQVDIQTVLRQGGRSAIGLARDATRSVYIAGQVALALVLLVSAGLLIRTAIASQRVPLWFSPTNVVSGRTALPATVYRNAAEISRVYDRILQHLRTQPGVISAALASKVPLSTSSVGLSLKADSVVPPLKQDAAADLNYLSDGYFSAMHTPLRQGREFTTYDRAGSTQVILVSDSLAKRLWPTGQAMGQTVRIPELEGRTSEWQVVGVVADVRANGSLSEAPAVLYLPLTQASTDAWHWIEQSLYLVARTQTEAMSGSALLQHSLDQVDPDLPLSDVRTMDQRLASSALFVRLYTLALALLGACGLLLTMAGIYGVVSYFVNRQRAEIGVRLALGSSKTGVLLLIVGQGMKPVLVGALAGLLAALAAARLLTSQLYGLSAADPLTLTVVTLLLLAVAAVACYLPARQAARIDPMLALRSN